MEEILGRLLLIAFLLIIASLPFNVVMLLWLRRDQCVHRARAAAHLRSGPAPSR